MPTSLSATENAVLNCVVTDDDEFSRQTLESHIAQTPGLALGASFADGLQLLQYLRTAPSVDVLFLDVQMPHLTGLDVIRLLPEPPAIILTTARADFAVQAFELQVADYLVKPIDYPRFFQAVERVRRRQPAAALTPPPAVAPSTSAGAQSLFVKSAGRLLRISYADILFIEAVGNQSVVVTAERQISSDQLLRDLTARLPEPQFLRIHRSYVVNRHRIEAIEDATVVLEGGRRLPIGRTYLAGVMASFQS